MFKRVFYLDPEATPGMTAETVEETPAPEQEQEVSKEQQLVSNLTDNGVDLDKLEEAIVEAKKQKTNSDRIVDVAKENEDYFNGLRNILK